MLIHTYILFLYFFLFFSPSLSMYLSMYIYIYIYISLSSVCTFIVLHSAWNKWVFSEINFSDLAGHVKRALLFLRGKLRGTFVKIYFPPHGLNALTTFVVKTVTNIRTERVRVFQSYQSNRTKGSVDRCRSRGTITRNINRVSDNNYRSNYDHYRFRKFHWKRYRVPVRVFSCFISSSLFHPFP